MQCALRCDQVHMASNMVKVFFKYPTPRRFLPVPVPVSVIYWSLYCSRAITVSPTDQWTSMDRILTRSHPSPPEQPSSLWRKPLNNFKHFKYWTWNFFYLVVRFTYLGIVGTVALLGTYRYRMLSKVKTHCSWFSNFCKTKTILLFSSVADQWLFGVDPDPDPRIHASD